MIVPPCANKHMKDLEQRRGRLHALMHVTVTVSPSPANTPVPLLIKSLWLDAQEKMWGKSW